MEGMTMTEFTQIVEFVDSNHKFGFKPRSERILTTENGFKHHHNINYVGSSYDTISEKIWYVKLIGAGFNFRFAINDELPENFPYTKLYDWVMAFLTGEWKPSVNMLAIISEKI